jgi:hypothetical protein
MARGIERRKLFRDDKDRNAFLETLNYCISLFVFRLMPLTSNSSACPVAPADGLGVREYFLKLKPNNLSIKGKSIKDLTPNHEYAIE